MPQENEDCRTHFDVVTTNLIWNYDSIIRDPNAFTEVSNVFDIMKTTQMHYRFLTYLHVMSSS